MLSFSPKAGESVLADFGILRGVGTQTIQRLYWNNLNTSIVSDIPSEARLQPANWGLWTFRAYDSKLREPDPAAVKATIPGLLYDLFQPARNFEGRVPDFSKMQPTRAERLTPSSSPPTPRNSRAFDSPVTSPFPRTGFTLSTCSQTRKAVSTSATARSCKETATKPSPTTATFS